ncbi:MAG: hypothetical protein ACT4PU_10745 [Planctomycetota bacterium]
MTLPASCRLLVSRVLCALMLGAGVLNAQSVPAGFAEDFALAEDRARALEQLVPGSPEWFYYRCLHLQHSGALHEALATLEEWRAQHQRSAWMEEIENRQALLAFQTDPAAGYAFLVDRLKLRFDHRRTVPGAELELPTRLDPDLIGYEVLLARTLSENAGSLDGLTDRGLERLEAASLSAAQLTRLLTRIQHPDRPGLAALVVQELRSRNEFHFGRLQLHFRLLLDQLQECARLEPRLLADDAFVEVWVGRLRPGSDRDWKQDEAELDRYLRELEAFVRRLPPVHNSLKAQVLYHRLALEWRQGRVDPALLLDYVRLPRLESPRNLEWVRAQPDAELVEEDASHAPLLKATGLSAIGDEEGFLRELLIEVLREAPNTELFEPYLDPESLQKLLAEAMLLHGVGAGTPEELRWYALLGTPAEAEELRSRVEVRLAPTNRRSFGAQEAVFLDLELKHVDALLVRVFEIDAFNVYTTQRREIEANLPLDGLVANQEDLYTFAEHPLRRVTRRFDFPNLNRPGVFIVEFVVGGLASRVVIHKGRLQHAERVGSAGHVFQVFAEDGQFVPEASLWLDGQLYRADAQGEIAVPFTSATQKKTGVLIDGAGQRASLASFQHLSEFYELQATAYVDRESLLPGHVARLLVRPTLLVQGNEASLELLQEPVLSIRAVSNEGVETAQQVRDLVLSDVGELVHDFLVPERLTKLAVSLSGQVVNLSTGELRTLAAPSSDFHVNAIRNSQRVASAVLSPAPDGYVLDVLGLSGEALPQHPVELALRHLDFVKPVRVTLRSDERGRVTLGPLPRIDSVTIDGFHGRHKTWELLTEERTWPSVLHGLSGVPLRVPAPMGTTRPERSRVAFFETRDGVPAHDRFEQIHVVDGAYELRDLLPGSYALELKEELHRIQVEITEGVRQGDWLVGRDRLLSATASEWLQLSSLTASAAEVVVQLAGVGSQTRVHVVATRYLPPFNLLQGLRPLWLPADGTSTRKLTRPEALDFVSREISDEQRYVLDRRHVQKFPGNMLARPTLLLNAWSLETTDSKEVVGSGGGGKGASSGAPSKLSGRGGSAVTANADQHPGLDTDFSFLPKASVVLANLRPDDAGRVRVPREALGSGHFVQVLAVDAESAVLGTLTLTEQALQPKDLRLARAYDATQHLSVQRRIAVLSAGAETVIQDLETSRWRILDSLSAAFQLLQTLSGEDDLETFQFLLAWPSLTREERLALLSKHGCHELHLFVHERDPELFAEVVRPHLANKLHPTFLDHWLLGADLSRYLLPWEFGQLNVVERILLARRVPKVAEIVRRQLDEDLALRPMDLQAERHRFEAALRGSALQASGEHSELQALGYTSGAEEPSMHEQPADSDFDEASLNDTLGPSSGLLGRGRTSQRDLELRKRQRSLYRGPEATREFAEHNYWHRFLSEQDARLVPVNGFWLDLAAATSTGAPLLSGRLAEAASSVNEMLLALALIELPFEPGVHERRVEGQRLSLRAASSLLLVREELEPAAAGTEATPVFVRQNFLRADDQQASHDGEPAVLDEFLAGVVYRSQVVIANPSPVRRVLSVLSQVPQGALAVGADRAVDGREVRVESYETKRLESFFYFPSPGEFAHYPAQVAQQGTLLGAAPAATRRVVSTPSVPQTESWEHVSQHGTAEQLWEFLERQNLLTINWDRLAWRLREPPFFRAAVDWLGARQTYVDVVWSYGLYHRDLPATRDFLKHQAGFVARCGEALESPLLSIDPIERRLYEHLEYEPLLNARAHPFGSGPRILDESLATQYQRFLSVLGHQSGLDARDWLSVTYYFLLQDRVEEALAAFARVSPEQLPGRLHYDLMQAYLDLFTSNTARARALAEAQRDHPLPRWQARFREVLAHLDEAEGRTTVADAQSQGEPTLEVELSGERVQVRTSQMTSCELRYFPMDAELLFSRDPFGDEDTDIFATIRPSSSETLALDPAGTTLLRDLPPALRAANILIEVRGAGLTRRIPRYASQLSVQFTETRGELRVTHAERNAPLAAVYVKVFAETPAGKVRFHKDGYTDLRGRFDYASVSGASLKEVKRFAILVLSETDGTVIREIAPPAR